MSSISAYFRAGLRSLLLMLMIWEFFADAGIVMVESCCNGAVIIGVILEMSKMFAVFAVRLDEFAGSTASTINGGMSSVFFRPEYLMRGCDVVFGTVANSN